MFVSFRQGQYWEQFELVGDVERGIWEHVLSKSPLLVSCFYMVTHPLFDSVIHTYPEHSATLGITSKRGDWAHPHFSETSTA